MRQSRIASGVVRGGTSSELPLLFGEFFEHMFDVLRVGASIFAGPIFVERYFDRLLDFIERLVGGNQLTNFHAQFGKVPLLISRISGPPFRRGPDRDV